MRLQLALWLSLACGPATADLESSTGSSTTDDEAVRCDPAFDSGLPPGQTIWTQLLERGTGGLASAVAVDEAGFTYVAGAFFHDPYDSDAWLHAIAVDGRRSWEARHAGEEGLSESYSELALTPAGDIVLLGREEMRVGVVVQRVESVFAYGADGRLLWRTELVDIVPVAIAVRSDGRIVLGGTTGLGLPVLCRLEASGAMSTCENVPLGSYLGLVLADIAIDPLDRLYVVATGSPSDKPYPEEWLGIWDAEGSIARVTAHGHPGAAAVAVAADEDGALVLGTIASVESFATRPILRRYSANAVELWSYEPVIDDGTSLPPEQLALDCDGDALILSSITGPAWLLRVAEDGMERARTVLELDRGAAFYDMTTDPFGNLVAAGMEENKTFFVHKFAR